MILRSLSASQEGGHCNNQSINLECLDLRWEEARINTSLKETLATTIKHDENHTGQGRHHQAIPLRDSNSLPFKKQQMKPQKTALPCVKTPQNTPHQSWKGRKYILRGDHPHLSNTLETKPWPARSRRYEHIHRHQNCQPSVSEQRFHFLICWRGLKETNQKINTDKSQRASQPGPWNSEMKPRRRLAPACM